MPGFNVADTVEVPSGPTTWPAVFTPLPSIAMLWESCEGLCMSIVTAPACASSVLVVKRNCPDGSALNASLLEPAPLGFGGVPAEPVVLAGVEVAAPPVVEEPGAGDRVPVEPVVDAPPQEASTSALAIDAAATAPRRGRLRLGRIVAFADLA